MVHPLREAGLYDDASRASERSPPKGWGSPTRIAATGPAWPVQRPVHQVLSRLFERRPSLEQDLFQLSSPGGQRGRRVGGFKRKFA